MFKLFDKSPSGQTVRFKIVGMHCVSCGINIDGELEEIAGVISAQTNYAKSQTTVVFDKAVTSIEAMQQAIEGLGYTVSQVEDH